MLIGTGEIAFATEPQVGRWAVDQRALRRGGRHASFGAADGHADTLRWAEESCTIGKMYKADRALYIEGRCSNGAGADDAHPITLAMKGERLAVTWNGEQTEMRRCR